MLILWIKGVILLPVINFVAQYSAEVIFHHGGEVGNIGGPSHLQYGCLLPEAYKLLELDVVGVS